MAKDNTAQEEAQKTTEPEPDSSSGNSQSPDTSQTSSKTELGPREAYCSSCGEIIKEEAEVCPECGVRQSEPAHQQGGGGQDIPNSPRNPLMAGILSVIMPGLGQAYNQQLTKGGVMFVAMLIAWASSTVLIGFVLGPILHIYAAYDARAEAYRINEQHFS